MNVLRQSIKDHTINCIGMGYVGLTLATQLADVGFKVVGYDINKDLIKRLGNADPHFFEKGLKDYLHMHIGKNLLFKTELEPNEKNIFIVSVSTPIDKKTYKPIMSHVESCSEYIGGIIKKGNLIIMRSTAPARTIRDVVMPIITKHSDLKAGEDYFVASAPERTIEGKALAELRTNPQIVGGIDSTSLEMTVNLFSYLTRTIIPVESVEAAEMCKLIDNTFRDYVFAYANQMSKLCEAMGLDFTKLAEAVNYNYPRNRVPKPSPGVGGPCLSKDPYILMDLFNDNDVACDLFKESRKINESGADFLFDKLDSLLKKEGKNINDSRIFIAGFAFKGEPETSDMRDSTTLWMLDLLKPTGAKIVGFDPIIPAMELEALGVEVVEKFEDGVKDSDAVLIMNNHSMYSKLNIGTVLKSARNSVVLIDAWHVFEPNYIKSLPGVILGGVGND